MQQETQVNVDAIKQWEITPEGYLQIDIPIARPGVLVYDRNRGDAFTAKEYRSADELFNQDSMNTLIGKPVTVSHPRNGLVTSKNYRAVSAGVVTAVMRQGDELVARALVQDEKSIRLIQQDKRLRGASAGYQCDEKPKQTGRAPDGQEFDTVQKGINYNHLSIVRNPRVKTATFNLDGEPMELEEALAKIEQLETDKKTLTSDLSTVRGDLLKANNRLVNMDSASNEAYERGVADGRQEHQLKDTAKRLNINTDSLGDISLVKQAIIRKANPEVNMDSWSDEQVDVALSMALVACGKKFEQKPRNPRINNDESGAGKSNDAHSDYQSRMFGKKEAEK
ncbi:MULTISPECIES: DUF2213 domain-containing protein [Citrobacter]|uniref:DUF2213 domain-containing protein n=1 Tax=Citrobacter TaxID=544 RepID=UPI0002729201|nr:MULTISPECIES: DUF2213 domain-containing protein [Citrobacter]EJF20777.1 hypothetical protein WYG_4269 [Citrobacter sp. A1]EKU32722.1 hypothetical protein B397_3977 [Citrobacter sp. L17]QGJ41529.1 DUF2213 domain-containing protein [Citrobacter freundii]QGJ47554.1 DUF2213 domain-containing protein [Citrobacter freundii]QGJ49877.1 DUF2213 domain-containing protein [Citrobacter freundii]